MYPIFTLISSCRILIVTFTDFVRNSYVLTLNNFIPVFSSQEFLERDITKTLAEIESLEQMIQTKLKPLLKDFPDIKSKTEEQHEKGKIIVSSIHRVLLYYK